MQLTTLYTFSQVTCWRRTKLPTILDIWKYKKFT